MTQNEKKDSFIVQAGILAVAGIICRIIGILYRSPLTGIIGDEGNGYYSSAYNIYTIILLISSYSIPSAISKVIAQRLALKEYKNAHRIFRCAFYYVIVVGGIASLFTFFGAGVLVEEHSIIVLRVFAPTIFLSGLLGVLRGYFQSHKTMIQTSISQIIEQIVNALISILAAYLLMQMVAGQDSSTQALYGAVGSAMGTGSGVLAALLFMSFAYYVNRKTIKRRVDRDTSKNLLSYGQIAKIIVFMVTPVILSTFIYNFSTSLNQTIYTKVMKYVYHLSSAEIATSYGIFAGKAVVISNIPIAIASAMSAAMIPSVSGSYAQDDIVGTNKKIDEAVHTTMLISIPAAVGLFTLATPIVTLLFPQPASIATASSLLRCLSITVVFYGLSTLTNAVLQGIGKVNLPVVNALVALILQTIAFVGLILATDLNLYSLAIAMICYSLGMCVLNGRSVKKCLGYRHNFKRSFILPSIAALIMGVGAYGTYQLAYRVISSNVLALMIAILIALVIYFVTVIRLGIIREKDFDSIPKGYMIKRLARKLKLL